MVAYYNEIDPAAAAILSNLIIEGVIATGHVDTRSIKEVTPDDIRGYTQCHFFAGGGLWSVAARLAGWPDDAPLWTGSCPCQPFSAAGKGLGTDDPRHLWPDFHRLIRACRPPVVMGEQVAGAAGYGWFDGVRADLEGEGYASRAVDFPACSVDAPHQRNRQYWIAVEEPNSRRREGRSLFRPGEGDSADQQRPYRQLGRSDGGELEHAAGVGRGEGRAEHELRSGWATLAGADASGVTLGDAERAGLEGHGRHGDGSRGSEQDRPVASPDGAGAAGVGLADGDEPFVQRQSPARQFEIDEQDDRARGRNGTHWSDAGWIVCHDGKARRAKPGLRLLVDGLPGRVDLWRVGGNAIVPQAAAEVIGAFIDAYGIPGVKEPV